MPTPTDLSLNDRIALAKGWRRACYRQRTPHPNRCEKEIGPWCEICPLNAWAEWIDPTGEPAIRPNFVGTLEGVSGMLWELGEEWTLHPDPPNGWLLWRDEFVYGVAQTFDSPREKLGDCAADAWLYVFEKEAADASITD